MSVYCSGKGERKLNAKCIAHTALSEAFLSDVYYHLPDYVASPNERAALALTAIRTCYSPLPPTQILPQEGAKYFGQSASDGEGGTESDRLFRHIMRSGHASTLEHVSYTFAIEGVSRALLAQLTRHRQLSFSVQSQRYVKFGSDDKSGGFDYVTPDSVGKQDAPGTDRYYGVYGEASGLPPLTASEVYEWHMQAAQLTYDALRAAGVPAEDARMVLPQASTCNLVLTGNLRALLEFYSKRHAGTHAQHEIRQLAEAIRSEITKIDTWTQPFFDYYSQS